MTPDNNSSYSHHKPAKDWLIFALKLLICFAITYSFTRLADWYAAYPGIRQLAYGLNTFLTASILISIGRFIVINLYRSRNKKNRTVRGSFVLGINQFAAILNVVFIILGLMLAFGINPKEFLTSITIVAMAIALLFREYITNMISGLLIMFSDQFTIGDNVKIGDHQGKIVDITLVNILVKNEDDDVVLIPNNTAFTANIINQSLQNSRKMSMDFQLPLSHAYHQQSLESKLEEFVRNYGEELVEDSFQLKVVSVAYDAVHYKVQFQVNTKDRAKRRRIRNDFFLEVISYEAEQAEKLKSS